MSCHVGKCPRCKDWVLVLVKLPQKSLSDPDHASRNPKATKTHNRWRNAAQKVIINHFQAATVAQGDMYSSIVGLSLAGPHNSHLLAGAVG